MKAKTKIFYLLDIDLTEVSGPTSNEIDFLDAIINEDNLMVAIYTQDRNRQFIKSKQTTKLYTYIPPYYKRLSSFFKYFPVMMKFIHIYNTFKPDVIITRLSHMPILEMLVAIAFGKKMYVKTASRFWNIKPPSRVRERIYWFIIEYMNKIILKRAEAIDSVTSKFKESFIHQYKIESNKIAIISNAVNLKSFYPFEHKSKRYEEIILDEYFPILGYVGNAPSERGANHLVKIYKRVEVEFPKVCIVIVGDDNNLVDVKRYAKENKINNIFFLGVVPFNKVPGIINLLDIGYSFTTDYDLKEVGNSSQKLRQYLACGKPVITMPGDNDFVEANGLGYNVCQDHFDDIAIRTIQLANKIQEDKQYFKIRNYEYAKKYLSIEQKVRERLSFWNSRSNILDETQA